MSWSFHSRRYYASDAQLVPLAGAATPLDTMVDLNRDYLLNGTELLGWCKNYLHRGKTNFIFYKNKIKHIDDNTKYLAGLDDKVTMNDIYDYDISDELKEQILKDLEIDTEQVEEVNIDCIDANDDEETYVKCKIDGYDFNTNTITENDVTYHYVDYWFNEDSLPTITTIRVYFQDDDGNQITKTIPMYGVFNWTEFSCYEYLIVDVTYKDGTIKYWMLDLPNDGTKTLYQYGDIDFSKTEDKKTQILPLIPLRRSRRWHNEWQSDKITATRVRKIKGQEYDWTTTNPPYGYKKSDSKEKRMAKLWRKCKYTNRHKYWKIYRQCCRKMSLDIRQQLSVIFNITCGIQEDVDSDGVKENLYTAFTGLGCPLHAIKADNCEAISLSDFPTVYKQLVKDNPKRPDIPAYAYYTYHSSDGFFDSEKDEDGNYEHKHFAKIKAKLYKPNLIQAISHYMFMFFDRFNSTTSGKQFSITHKQGYGTPTDDDEDRFGCYDAKITWNQKKKQTVFGTIPRRYWYDWSAHNENLLYYTEVVFSGEYKRICTVVGLNTDSTYYQVPIYYYITYLCEIETEQEQTDWTYESYLKDVDGIPIIHHFYADYNKTTATNSTWWKRLFTTFDTNNWASSDKVESLGEDIIGKFTYNNPEGKIKFKRKKLYSIGSSEEISQSFVDFGYIRDGSSYKYIKDTNEYLRLDVVNDGAYTKAYYDTNNAKKDSAAYPTDMLLKEGVINYILSQPSDLDIGEYQNFTYYHRINSTTYEAITISNPSIEWSINPNLGNQHKGTALNGLAPDSNMYFPIIPEITKKLSFIEALIVYDYSLKQAWTFWHSEKKSWWVRHRGHVFGVVFIVIGVILLVLALIAIEVPPLAAALFAAAMAVFSLWKLFDPDAPKWVTYALFAMAIATIVYSAAIAITTVGISTIAADLALNIGCQIASVVFDICYNTKGIQNSMDRDNDAYSSASTALANKNTQRTSIGGNVSALAKSLTFGSNIIGLDSNAISDMMVSTIYPCDFVYATMDLDLGTALTITNGTT